MKKLLLMALLFASITGFSQKKRDLVAAKAMLQSKGAGYNPAGAFSIYTKYALSGNAEAMNGLGLMYAKGIRCIICTCAG
jgi:TPR repeat protein